MRHLTYCLVQVIFLLAVCCCAAQDQKYALSRPVDLEMAGVNKVLQMSNGNTLLFHFEQSKGIVVKVFDSTHKEIASRRENCRLLDVFVIQNALFKGLFETGGEAVLFFDQENRLNRHCLIRLQFNATTGKLVNETLVAESKNKDKRIHFYLMKKKNEDRYAVLFSTTKNYPKTCDIYMVYFNSHHEGGKEIQLDVDRKKFDYVDAIGAEYLATGVVVTLSMSKVLQNGTVSHGKSYDASGNVFGAPTASAASGGSGPVRNVFFQDPQNITYDEYDPTPTLYNHYAAVYYVPEGATEPRTKLADLSTEVYPFHTFFSNNSFAGSLNLLLLSYKDAYVMYGLERLPGAIMNNLFLKVDESTLAVSSNVIKNAAANRYLKEKTDTSRSFIGVPLSMTTNENGLSTLVSESFTRYASMESPIRPKLFETWLGNIAVTQFDDDGNEIWGMVIPRSQYYKSYMHYYYANEMLARWQENTLFSDQPEQVYNRQFLSLNTYVRGKNHYIIFNDADRNFNKTLSQPGDTVYYFDQTNTVCYTIDGRKEVSKRYLFGNPQKREYKCSFVEGADFDEQRGVYASLVQYKKGDNTSLRMAWCYLD